MERRKADGVKVTEQEFLDVEDYIACTENVIGYVWDEIKRRNWIVLNKNKL